MSKANPIRFATGQIVMTPGVMAAADAVHGRIELTTFLARHLQNDWGDLEAGDIEANDQSVQGDSRILSAYYMQNGTKIWIITEGDRSATTFLLPEEY